MSDQPKCPDCGAAADQAAIGRHFNGCKIAESPSDRSLREVQFRAVIKDHGDREADHSPVYGTLERAQEWLRDEMRTAEPPYDMGWVEFQELVPWQHISSLGVRRTDDSNDVPELALPDEDGGGDLLRVWQNQDGTVGIRTTEGDETALVNLSAESADGLMRWLQNLARRLP